MPGYEHVHAGDIVLGHDRELWGVEHIEHSPQLAVTLVRHGRRITGYPPVGTEVVVVTPADVSLEASVAQRFIEAGLGPVTIVREHWEV